MTHDSNANLTPISDDLYEIEKRVGEVVQQCDDDPMALLELLRLLEGLHREICETRFQPVLPQTRQALYAFLRELDTKGGWPYIPRMRLRTLLAHLEAANEEE
ncbi:MAG: hypothetical protein J7641_02765 [Cyanobacteria bacterium SID2]|nr:hypothetical protein [Cyanobacteria bacterium SID2]MBP0003860.1 hypothetical protein [Cyanobacteria bacterium SBC]